MTNPRGSTRHGGSNDPNELQQVPGQESRLPLHQSISGSLIGEPANIPPPVSYLDTSTAMASVLECMTLQ